MLMLAGVALTEAGVRVRLLLLLVGVMPWQENGRHYNSPRRPDSFVIHDNANICALQRSQRLWQIWLQMHSRLCAYLARAPGSGP